MNVNFGDNIIILRIQYLRFVIECFSLYPSPKSLGMFKPHGIYKPLDRLMRYDGITNGTPRYHPGLSIFKVSCVFHLFRSGLHIIKY